MTTPGPGGPQPPEQDPAQSGRAPSGQPQDWGQPPAGQPGPGQPFPGQQPPAGQQFWSAPGGAPPQPGGAQAPGGPGQPGRPTRRWVPIVLGVVLVLAVIVLALSFLGGNSAQAGDCVNDAPDEIGVVDCNSDEAAFEVVGVLDDVSQNDMNDETSCNDWPETVFIAWEGPDTGTDDLDAEGTGYCLVELGS